jgi:proline dehydrogenase
VATPPAVRLRDALRGTGKTAWAPVRRRSSAAYRAGASLAHALDASRRLAGHGLRSTIGYAAFAGESPRAVADAYRRAFDRLGGSELDCYVSVKLAALDFDGALLREISEAAARSGRRLHADALGPESADATWRLLEQLPPGAVVSTTLPGRWRRSLVDAERAVEHGLAVRVVKGQWPDPEGDRIDAGRGFLEVVERLAGRSPFVAVATHDVRLLAQALERLAAAGTDCEAELFYGLPLAEPARTAQSHGVPVRVYVPYGDAGAPYRAADLRRPTVARWLARDLVHGADKPWRELERLG